jgi:hypothetical protein
MPHPEPERREHAPPGTSLLAGLTPEQGPSRTAPAYHRRILEHGDRLGLDQVLDLYRDQWAAELEDEQVELGVDWEEELSEHAAFELGRQAIELAMAELIPHLGDPSSGATLAVGQTGASVSSSRLGREPSLSVSPRDPDRSSAADLR